MKTVGIICEYNPFHEGHEYMINELRRGGAESVICIMSGNAVQRGELAILPKDRRAAAALASGADAVLELPYPWCAASAEFFARAGVYALAALGVDTIAFGSECADAEALSAAARRAARLSPRSAEDRGSTGSAEEYFNALGDIKPNPNDILAVEYLKAVFKMKLPLDFEVIRRVGAGYNDSERGEGYPSATAVRAALVAGEGYFGLPAASAAVLDEALASGEAPVCIKNAEAAMLAFWRMARDSEALSALAECGGGVAGRLHSCAVKAASAEEFFALAATKKYTNARLRRAALFGLTGVTYADLDALPAYLNLLAVNKNGRAFISAAKRRGGIEIVTKPSRIPDTAAARRQSELARNLDAIYTLAMPKKRENGFFLTKSPIITEIS